MNDTINLIMGFVYLAALFAGYWLPTIIVLRRKHPAPGPTIVVNALLGWTGIGWIVALAMSLGRRGVIA